MTTKVKDEGYKSVYKREIKTTKDGRLIMGDQEYVEVPTAFADEMVKLMKNNTMWEDIIVVNSSNYMRKDRFDAYKAPAKVMKNS